jgi:ABC-2 type transport system permease protein
VLFRTLLLSTSSVNIFKHTSDKKKKKKILLGFFGLFCLYAMLIGYSIATCIGYGKVGIIDSAPVLSALSISVLAFVFTFFKTNGYLFNFKEYDMLMALPFKVESVAACKFLYMYVKNLPWYLSISLSFMVGYGIFKKPSFFVYPVWIFLSFILPIIPMLGAAFLGFIIARISAGFKKNNIVQTILMFALVLFSFSIRFIMEDMFKNDKVDDALESLSEKTDEIAGKYLPAKWFGGTVNDLCVSDMLLLTGVSLVLFAALFALVGRSYRNINSAMKSHAAAKNYKMTSQKKSSVLNSIAFKEFKRLTGSTNYMVNGAMGEVLSVLLGLGALIIGFDRIVEMVTEGAPIDTSMLRPAIPFIVYFMIGMVATTVCSPSLEGKNYWIVQSLPIEKKTLYQGKMLFNMYLSVPFTIFANLCLCISAKVPVLESILYIILGVSLCAFSTTWGCVVGVKHMRLDWENEIEVIKQSAAVAIYLFPNMIVTMGLVVLMVILGRSVDHNLLAVIMILISSTLSALSYARVMALAKRSYIFVLTKK